MANRAAGSPELSYFGNANPYPGFNKAPGYAQGGMTGGGVTSLFGSPDGTMAQNTLKEGYGLGRLNNLASAAATENAKEYGFDAGGYVPTMGGAPSYGIAPTDLSTVAAIPTAGGAEASTPSGLSALLGNAITDPMGRTTGASQGGMGGKGGQGGQLAQGFGVGGIDVSVRCHVAIPDEYLFDDELFVRYCIAKSKIALSQMLSVFTYNLPGGVTINASEIGSQGNTELQEVMDMINGENTPSYFLQWN
jgi:hypothetical protein